MLPTQALFVTFAVYRNRYPQPVGSLAGFTLTELVITVAVLAIVATLAAPSFTNMIRRNQLSTATNEVMATLHFARAEAIRTNASVRVCAGNFADSTDNACDIGSTDWRRMLVVSTKADLGLLRDTSVSEQLVVSPRANVTASTNRVTFGADGFVVGSGADRTGTLRVCRPGLSASQSTFDVGASFGRITNTRVEGETC